ncbi:hypothetical protein IFM12276_00390 [Nocardia sputorum]|uniref:Transposase n=1 Tax=Nocardia sputorum TaxID=2984338 RepID=A0ABM8CQ76_9NOCA|nr:hypothetical protein IFM12276_00390 [Nocardia sputorum]
MAQLAAQAGASGLQLSGEGGLQQLTKLVVESALDGEITDHLGYDHGDLAGRGTGQLTQEPIQGHRVVCADDGSNTMSAPQAVT